MYEPGKVFIVGGSTCAPYGECSIPPTPTAEAIDLNAPAPAWRSVAQMAYARKQHNATILPDGKVLVTGGTSGSGGNDNAAYPVYPAEMWDPGTNSWTTLASMSVYRGYHSTALLLPDGRVLSAGGGFTGPGSAEVYSPPYLFKGARPTITSAPTTVGYNQTFSVGTPDAAGITKVTLVRLSAVTHAFNFDQRINSLSFSATAGGLNVTSPASRNVCPPGHYMLFILNGNGVPSVAKIINIK